MRKRRRQLHRNSRGEALANLVVEYGERIYSQDHAADPGGCSFPHIRPPPKSICNPVNVIWTCSLYEPQ